MFLLVLRDHGDPPAILITRSALQVLKMGLPEDPAATGWIAKPDLAIEIACNAPALRLT